MIQFCLFVCGKCQNYKTDWRQTLRNYENRPGECPPWVESLVIVLLWRYCEISGFPSRSTAIFTYLPSTSGSCKFNHYMHACLARNYPEALSHCGYGHDLTSVAQLSVVNIADIRSPFTEMPSKASSSREARQRQVSLLYDIIKQWMVFLHLMAA